MGQRCDAAIHTNENNWVITVTGRKYLVIAAAGDHYWGISVLHPGHRPATIHKSDIIEVAPNPLGKRRNE